VSFLSINTSYHVAIKSFHLVFWRKSTRLHRKYRLKRNLFLHPIMFVRILLPSNGCSSWQFIQRWFPSQGKGIYFYSGNLQGVGQGIYPKFLINLWRGIYVCSRHILMFQNKNFCSFFTGSPRRWQDHGLRGGSGSTYQWGDQLAWQSLRTKHYNCCSHCLGTAPN
jgi:hypothetical protein